MNSCISCKYYEMNNLTELGLCKKHNLSMHLAAVQECYEEKTNDNNKLLNQINKIVESSNAMYIKDFKEDIRSISRLFLGCIDGIEFDEKELNILGDLAAANMKRIIDQEVENIKKSILHPASSISCIKKKSFNTYSNNGVKTSHIETLD